MPGGIREERLRAWVKKRLKAEHGKGAELARHLRRPSSWMTNYIDRERDADLDTAIEIAGFFQVPLRAIIGDVPLPEIEPTTQRTIVRVATRTMADLLPKLTDRQLRILMQTARDFQKVAAVEGAAPASESAAKTLSRSR